MAYSNRSFGMRKDPVSGGSAFEDLVVANYPTGTYTGYTNGTIPNANTFLPVTGGSVDRNIERIDRNNEARGRRSGTAPLSFRGAPVMTVPMAAYRSATELSLKLAMNGQASGASNYTITPAGPPTTPQTYTHAFSAEPNPTTLNPALVQLVRDNLNDQMTGAYMNRVTVNFPIDGEGTLEMELWGKYLTHEASTNTSTTYGTPPSWVTVKTPPAVSFTSGVTAADNVLMLRDAQMFVNGSGTAIPDLQGFSMTWNNNLNRHWYAKRNVATVQFPQPGTTTPLTQTKKLWWPSDNRLTGMQDVTFSLQFGDVDAALELALDFVQIQKFVIEVAGDPLGASGVSEMIRFTLYNATLTGGGAPDLSARDDLTTSFDGQISANASGQDVLIESVNLQSADIGLAT